jgi:hypothetical protein
MKITINELRNLVKQIIKEEYSGDKYDNLKKFVIDAIDFSEYDDLDNTETKKLENGVKTFLDTQDYYIKRMGFKRAFAEYVAGLPSWIDLPMYDEDIINFMYSIGFDEVKNLEDEAVYKFFGEKVADIFYAEYLKMKKESKTLKENTVGGKSKYLVALPAFRGAKGFNHQTILLSAKDEDDAKDIVRHLKPHSNIGDIKKVNY